MRKLKVEELNRENVISYQQKPKLEVVLVLDNIRSMHNVGAIFRTSDAFLVKKIYLCGITATPPHKEIRKTALGATESVAWEYAKDALSIVISLKNEGYQLMAVEQAEGSVSLENLTPTKENKYALIVGNEVFGVDQKLIDECHQCIELPQEGTKHSLNVSVCTGIVLWEFFKVLKGNL